MEVNQYDGDVRFHLVATLFVGKPQGDSGDGAAASGDEG